MILMPRKVWEPLMYVEVSLFWVDKTEIKPDSVILFSKQNKTKDRAEVGETEGMLLHGPFTIQ